ncbi:ABC transporter permease [Candidatus Venteria ishoeyi]|uniref:Inner membrane ABC transporter permease protein YejE n=1 Tax=Candidatus Venteria ishoeyi TaxID=1899563 RepID=A0A1H6FGK5_9GAMM|nr:ABC transporter permease [Candidatus Venteria ishoeyi]MDM8548144.1 ABC transporter permease [Candidatus Venteria ishoeyi]SEH09210.1 Inner membrane ABC transporter permease protein YejE [Candidatus Venteria ishoeyi]SEH09335.1 Inner membrane ABC transporter permease protein YejE [Candidatus Venteria ishoeyi]
MSSQIPPARRAWLRFKANRRGYISLWIFTILFILSLFAEVLSNDKPLLIYYQDQYYFPLFKSYPETVFGGDFETETDYHDPYITTKLKSDGNWIVYALNPYSNNTINYASQSPHPAPPSSENWLGTDDRGRDVLARLIYGFRLSVLFAFALTLIGTIVGVIAGALQGYLGGRFDLIMQRFIEVWGSMPELYLLIIFASIFNPSILLLVILLSLFGWIGLADYVRAEFLRGRNMEYVKAARALGVSNVKIMWRHLLPNGLTPVLTFLPFRISGAITALTSLDYLGLGVPPTTPSLGELLAQGKANLTSWWLSFSTFSVLVGTLILLIFIGEAVREALDSRRG